MPIRKKSQSKHVYIPIVWEVYIRARLNIVQILDNNVIVDVARKLVFKQKDKLLNILKRSENDIIPYNIM